MYSPIYLPIFLLIFCLFTPLHTLQAKEKRKIEFITPVIFNLLEKIQTALESEDNETSLKLLTQLSKKTSLNPNEKAQLYNLWAIYYYNQSQTEQALVYWKKLLNIGSDNIRLSLEISTLTTISQLYFSSENYKEALKYAQRTLSIEPNPAPQLYIYLSEIYYQSSNINQSFNFAKKGFFLAKEKKQPIPEHWYQLLGTLYIKKDQLKNALPYFEYLVLNHPKKRYWQQLISIYSQLEITPKQNVAYEIASIEEFFTSPQDINNYFAVLISADMPYKAAKLLNNAIIEKTIPSNSKNYKKLGTAWYAAHHYKKAIQAFEQSAKLSQKPLDFIRLSQLYMHDNNLTKCLSALEQANDHADKLSFPHQLYLMKGICLYKQNNFKQAKAIFSTCSKKIPSKKLSKKEIALVNSSHRKNCQLWLNNTLYEIERRKTILP